MKLYYCLLLVVLFTLFSCSQVDNNLLIGKWKVNTVEGVSAKDMENMRDIKFEFSPNGRYTFQSTLNIKEAGRYSVSGDLLYTTDTILTTSKEKSVKIIKLTADSLYFLMNNSGQKQQLKFVRSK